MTTTAQRPSVTHTRGTGKLPVVAGMLLIWAPIVQAISVWALGIVLPVRFLATVVVLLAATSVSLGRRGQLGAVLGTPTTLMLAAFIALAAVGLLVTPEVQTGQNILISLVLYGFLPGIGVAVLERYSVSYIPTPRLMIALLFVALLFLLQIGNIDGTNRLLIDGASPIAIARSLGITLLFVLHDKRYGRRELFVVGLLAILGMALAGSRGPILAVVVAYLLTGDRSVVRNLSSLSLPRKLIALAVSSVAGITILRFTQQTNRLLAETAFEPGIRTELARAGLDLWRATPIFGSGAGAFESLGFDQRWSHNLVVELLSEHGIAGLLFFAGATWFAYRRVRKFGYPALSAALTFMLAAAMFSFSLSGNSPILWLLIACGALPRKRKSTS